MAVEQKNQNPRLHSETCPSHWFTEAVKAERREDWTRMAHCMRELRRLGWSVLRTGKKLKREG